MKKKRQIFFTKSTELPEDDPMRGFFYKIEQEQREINSKKLEYLDLSKFETILKKKKNSKIFK